MLALIGKRVLTRLGRGVVSYVLPDGCVLVVFDHGGGHVFTKYEAAAFVVARSTARPAAARRRPLARAG